MTNESTPLKGKKAKQNEPFKMPNKGELPNWVFINPLAWIALGLDLGLMLLTFKWVGLFKSFSPPVTVDSKGVTRLAGLQGLANEKGDETAWDKICKSFSKYGSRRSMGTRKYLGEHQPEGVRFPKKMFGAIQWRTYAEVGERARNIGKGLMAVGVEPLPKDEGPDLPLPEDPTTALP